MLDQGYITKAQYEEALADNVYERIQATDSSQETATPYSYFIDELTSQIITDLPGAERVHQGTGTECALQRRSPYLHHPGSFDPVHSG